MKRCTNLSLLFLLLPLFVVAQEMVWPLYAVRGGELLPVNAYFEDGSILPVHAIMKEGDAHFMDVKVTKEGESYPIKLMVSNDYYSPVKAILPDGKLVNIKVDGKDENLYDLKGVSRDGNTVKISAITPTEKFFAVKAISPEGKSREVRGIKFIFGNAEMTIAGNKVLAHVKAIPALEVSGVDPIWPVKALHASGDDLAIIAISAKGKEYPIKAKMQGNSAHVMNIRASSSNLDIYIKLIKEDDFIYALGIDDYGRKYEVKAKDDQGNLYEVVGGEKQGNIIGVKVKLSDGTLLPVKAFSSKGHVFDVKGIKLTNDEIEGTLFGEEDFTNFYAHIKAIAPID